MIQSLPYAMSAHQPIAHHHMPVMHQPVAHHHMPVMHQPVVHHHSVHSSNHHQPVVPSVHQPVAHHSSNHHQPVVHHLSVHQPAVHHSSNHHQVHHPSNHHQVHHPSNHQVHHSSGHGNSHQPVHQVDHNNKHGNVPRVVVADQQRESTDQLQNRIHKIIEDSHRAHPDQRMNVIMPAPHYNVKESQNHNGHIQYNHSSNSQQHAHEARAVRDWTFEAHPQVDVSKSGNQTNVHVGGSVSASNNNQSFDIHGGADYSNGHNTNSNIGVGYTIKW